MGKLRANKYKDKKGSSCKMCKPHKNGRTPHMKDKHKVKINLYGTEDYPYRKGMTNEEIREAWKLLDSPIV